MTGRRSGPPYFDTPLQKASLAVVVITSTAFAPVAAGYNYPGSLVVLGVCLLAAAVIAVLVIIKRFRTGSWQ